jgi:hypothetical protein
MDGALVRLNLVELENSHVQWERKRRVFWSALAVRPALANGVSNLPFFETRVLRGRAHPFKRARKQHTDGVEHSPETHPGWIVDEDAHDLEPNAEDGEALEGRRIEAARQRPLSLHVGPTILTWKYGHTFFAEVSKTLAFASAQCMPSHPMHRAYMEHAKDSRERLARVPRELGEGFDELRRIRFKSPPSHAYPTVDNNPPRRCFRQFRPDECADLYRRVCRVARQVAVGDTSTNGLGPSANGHRIAAIPPKSGTYVMFSRDDFAVGQPFCGHGSVTGTVTGKVKAGAVWEYRVSGFRTP